MKRYTVLFIYLILLLGCGKTPIISTPGKQPVSPEIKAQQAPVKIHPTQRPYKINGKKYYPIPSAEGFTQTGIASWYGGKFHGRKTSNGETYNMHGTTSAHKTLPMNTHLLVKNLENGKEFVTRINDRGPFVKGRIIDLSLTGARELNIIEKGTARVEITALGEAVTVTRNNEESEQFLPHEDFQAGDFYVQIGSFTVENNAIRLKDKVSGWGKTTEITTFDRGDAFFYRVQVKAGNRLEEANRMERVMTESGFPDAFVVAR
ncbi:MAG: septal ring lytic transglycosylase RlpA family protein [Desulfobulbaceae bacterium]|uniref:Probable endolytic peptidoglycan transglycosylase RlpA n=1 Tax=Candidatus Desulfobia pelagia TaxID=2841692 RepID=A0A8J6NCC9_9BACT|nr:septal ring lytic transglycosylase RlpA family protein [Candidatus Desulfobia pelagia]